MIGKRIFLLHSISSANSEYSVSLSQFVRVVESRIGLVTFDDGYADILEKGGMVLSRLGHKTTIFLVAGKIGGMNDWDLGDGLGGKALLSWGEIEELEAMGVGFGSHSLTHRDLRRLSREELERETKDSKRIIEDRLGQPIEGFAYPFGLFDEKVIAAVEEAGYKWAVTTSDSFWEAWGDSYRLRRIRISGLDPDWLIWAKLSGLTDIKAAWEIPRLIWEKVNHSLRSEKGRP